MNFSCDKCQRRYSIADEKVRGKTVKVRCKHCQNVISVEGPPAEVEESTRVVSLADVERLRAQAAADAPGVSSAPAAQTPWEDEPTRAAPPREASAPWFVMVRNEQQGPLDEAALRELVASGAVNARSYFWQQGMADWQRGSELPELAHLFEPQPAPSFAPPSAPPVAEPEPQWQQPEPEPEPQWQQPEPEPQWQQSAASEPAWDDSPAAGTRDEPAWNDAGASAGDAPWDDEPRQEAREQQARPADSGVQLGELFSDLDLPGRSEENELPADEGDLGSEPEPDPEPTPAPAKPAKGKKGKKAVQQPGEHTRVAMVQSGVTRRNPWWKVVLAVLLVLALPVAAAFALDQLNVVPITVTRVNEKGQPVQQSVFTFEGASALRDKLLGKEPPPVPAPPEPKKPAEGKRSGTAPAPKPEPAETLGAEGEPPSEELQAVYASGEKQDVGPEVREDAEVAAPDSSEGSGPPPEELARVMGQVQPAIQSCIDAELKKNPKFRGGKVMLTATVGASGAVKRVSFDRPDVEGSKVGTCIKQRAKRMVFSSFEGEDVDLQIPLVLGTSM